MSELYTPRYLVITNDNDPFLTDYFDSENHFNMELGMVVMDLRYNKFTNDGTQWNDMEKKDQENRLSEMMANDEKDGIYEEKKEYNTSSEWMDMMPEKNRPIIVDHDGWDRGNFTWSYHDELITKEEFDKRCMNSTIRRKL